MATWQSNPGRIFLPALVLLLAVAIASRPARGQEPAVETAELPEAAPSAGLSHLDEAMKLRVTSTGLRDLNRVIEQLEKAIEAGLDVEDNDFAEQMLSDALMERSTALMQVMGSRRLNNEGMQKVRALMVSDLRRVLEYDNPVPTAYLMLGKLMALPGGDLHEARRVIDKYLAQEELPAEQHAEALVLRARLGRDESKALADMEQAIQLAPENMGYRLARVVLLRQSNKLDEAHAAIDEIIQLTPEDANPHIQKGVLYRQQNQLDKALASFDKATELAPEAPAPFQNRGEIYRQQENFEAAVKEFNEVLKLQPGVLMTLMHRADAYLANDMPNEALIDIDLVIEKQPLVAAHRLRAAILLKLDRLEEALEQLDRLATAMPEQPELKMQLALYYLVDKQVTKAIETYSEIIDQHPTHFSALQSRGDAYLNVGKHAEAVADFNQALQLQTDDTTLLNNLAWVLATSPDDDIRNGKRAIELATRACELTEYNTPHILSTLAAAYAESGQFDTAIKWSQKSVDMNDPEHAEQLVKELESYRAGKPWRERQSVEEKEPSQPPLVDTPQAPPTSANLLEQEEMIDPPKLKSGDKLPQLDPPIEN